MRARRLLVTLVASALSWGGLALVVATPDAQAAPHSAVKPGKHKKPKRDQPHDPATYYAGTEGLSGNALALALNAIIDGNTFLPYTSSGPDVWKALKVLDRDPNDPTKIIDAYNGDQLDPANQCGSSCALNGWNREHTWAQSRGSFDTSPGPGTDLFHMRPLRGNTNSSRGNKDFDNGGAANVPGCPNCHSDGDSFEPISSFKGDLARGLFYMDVRYNGDADDAYGVDLRLWNQVGNSGSQIGKLSTLVAWSLADPPNAAELNRNNLIDGDYQHNRNPFIDHPEWVCSIWGSQIPAGTCPTSTAPTATPQSVTTAEDTGKVITLAGTSSGGTLTYAIGTGPTHGSVNLVGNQATYTPSNNYNGPDSFTFTVNDGTTTSSPAAVSVTVTAVNDAPTATAQLTSTPQGTAKVITLAGADVDGDTLTFAKASDPAHGTVSVTPGGQATYTPDPGFADTDSFTFTVSDGTLTSAPATVTVNVLAASNHAPSATAQSTSTAEDTAKVISLAGSDVDGDSLTFAKASDPAHGTVSVTAAGQATYTPAANYSGPDSFTFTVSDGALTSAPATVSLTVTPVNDPPSATAQSVTTAEDTAKVITLAGTDVDGDTLTFAKASDPAHGTVAVTSGGQATYTPAANYFGPDSFTFTVNDGTVTSAASTVSVTVTPVNDAPVATAQSVTTAEDTAKVVTLAGTDADLDDELGFALGTLPAHGTVTLVENQATYTPVANYHGPDSFTFTVGDGTTTSAPATVAITVTPVNDAPTAGAQSASVAQDSAGAAIALAGADVDGDALTYALGTGPAHGTVTISGGTATYVPTAGYHGPDSFTYTANDGSLTSAPGTVSVTVVQGSPRTASLGVSTPGATRGQPVTTTITATGPVGPRPSGTVTLSSAGQTLGTATLAADGTARVTWTPQHAGPMPLLATYAGDGVFGAASTAGSADVAKAPAALTFSGKLKQGKRGKITVRVTTIGSVAAAGSITLKVGHQRLSGTVKNGVATFTVKHVPAKKKLKVTAAYSGDGEYLSAVGSFVFKLKK